MWRIQCDTTTEEWTCSLWPIIVLVAQSRLGLRTASRVIGQAPANLPWVTQQRRSWVLAEHLGYIPAQSSPVPQTAAGIRATAVAVSDDHGVMPDTDAGRCPLSIDRGLPQAFHPSSDQSPSVGDCHPTRHCRLHGTKKEGPGRLAGPFHVLQERLPPATTSRRRLCRQKQQI